MSYQKGVTQEEFSELKNLVVGLAQSINKMSGAEVTTIDKPPVAVATTPVEVPKQDIIYGYIPVEVINQKAKGGVTVFPVPDEVKKDADTRLGKWQAIPIYERHKGFEKYTIIFPKKYSVASEIWWDLHKGDTYADEHSIRLENGDESAFEWNERVENFMRRFSRT